MTRNESDKTTRSDYERRTILARLKFFHLKGSFTQHLISHGTLGEDALSAALWW